MRFRKTSARNYWKWSLGALLVVGLFVLLIIADVSRRNSITPAGIMIHHSAIPLAYGQGRINAETLDRVHSLRGYNIFYWGRTYHIGYHYVILEDGSIEQGRPEGCRGSHARGYNSYLGICLIGDFSESHNDTGANGPQTPTREQMRALVELIRDLQGRYGIRTDHVMRHRDVDSATECPGERFPFPELQQALVPAP